MDKDYEGGVVFPTMNIKKRKLNYTIHNPNSVEKTAKVLLDVLMEANTSKVENNLRDLAANDTEEHLQFEKENGVGVV